MGAAFFKAQHWQMDETEAKEVSRAIVEVQDQYDISIDPKTQAWVNLAFVLGMAYGPRIAASYHLAKQKPKEATAPKAPQNPRPGPQVPKPKMKNGEPELTTPSALFGHDYVRG
jgi:hypothetical protein